MTECYTEWTSER